MSLGSIHSSNPCPCHPLTFLFVFHSSLMMPMMMMMMMTQTQLCMKCVIYLYLLSCFPLVVLRIRWRCIESWLENELRRQARTVIEIVPLQVTSHHTIESCPLATMPHVPVPRLRPSVCGQSFLSFFLFFNSENQRRVVRRRKVTDDTLLVTHECKTVMMNSDLSFPNLLRQCGKQ